MRTIDEYRQQRPRLAARATNNPQLQAIAQEAVRMEAVTGDPAWDHYNAYLEAALKHSERLQKAEDAHLRDPYLVNDEEMRKVKATLIRLEARIDTLREVLMLPKYLKEQGALARAQIEEMAASEK